MWSRMREACLWVSKGKRRVWLGALVRSPWKTKENVSSSTAVPSEVFSKQNVIFASRLLIRLICANLPLILFCSAFDGR